MGLKKILAGIVAAAALIAMSGCTANTGNVAATVNDVVITESSLEASAKAFDEILSQDPRYAATDSVNFILTYEILAEMFAATQATTGISFTDAEREQLWKTSFTPNQVEYGLWGEPSLTSMMRGYIDLELTNQLAQTGNLDVTAVVTALNDVTVNVNPRHGSWDSQKWSVTPNTESTPVGALAEPVVFSIPD